MKERVIQRHVPGGVARAVFEQMDGIVDGLLERRR
jgi:hypothetical protein